jgi:hypothetical protein
LRTVLIISAVLLLQSCTPRVKTATIKQEAEVLRVQLMRTESEVYGDFHTLRTFHNDLFQSISRTDAAPYPVLDTLFDQLFAEANHTVGTRVNYDSTYWKIQHAIANKEVVKLKEPFTSMRASLPVMSDSLTRYQQQHRDAYFTLRLAYQDSCKANGIVRYNPQDYALILDEKLTQWQDSLEEVGRMVARCKIDLKQRFPEQKGKPFFQAYAPVSELEAMLKNFESILNQLQNSVSRFEEGNSQDFVYFGPYIRQRLEVAANDDLVGQLSLQMNDCRKQARRYFEGH